MLTDSVTYAKLRQLFKEEWQTQAFLAERNPPSPANADPHARLDPGSFDWLLPEMLQLSLDTADQPDEQLELALRRLLSEQCFVDAGGDVTATGDHDQRIDHFVEQLMNALVNVRHRAGIHHAPPATPMMFG